MELNNGLCILSYLVLVDTSFLQSIMWISQDTPHGKSTFHVTAMATYQRQEPGDVAPELTVDPEDQCHHSIRQLPESVTTLLECIAPPRKTVGPTFPGLDRVSKFNFHCTSRSKVSHGFSDAVLPARSPLEKLKTISPPLETSQYGLAIIPKE